MPQTTHGSPRAALVLVRLAASWILLGALFKLFVGSPNDLPPVVREFFLGPTRTFKLAIAIELSIALPALLSPRRLWPLVAAQLAVFCAILVPLIASGAESCGCFGSKVSVPPWVMLAIDASLLVLLLACRPWRAQRKQHRGPQMLVPIAGALLLAWIAPYSMIGSAGGTDAPSTARQFVDWDFEAWVGQPIAESPLATLIDVGLYPTDATWVVYSPTCGHCAAYLQRLEGEFASDPKLYVFLQLPADKGAERAVEYMPPGEEVVLPQDRDYVITPPWALTLEGGVVTAALHPEDV